MADRSPSKPSKQRLSSSLHTPANSHSARSYEQLTNWTNPLIQLAVERQRQARRTTTHDMSSRTVNIDRNHTRTSVNTSQRALIHNYQMAKREFSAQIRQRTTMRQVTFPTILPKIEDNDQRSTPIPPVHHTATNENPSESDSQTDQIETFQERLACQITMSYQSTTPNEDKSSGDEILVMQRYSSGETFLVYRGYLNNGESFSFKSQRRPNSPLSLAFYIQGTIDSMTTECCEFKCIQNNNQQKKFVFKDIQKANPCSKCRKDYAEQLMMNHQKNTLLVQKINKLSESDKALPSVNPTLIDKAIPVLPTTASDSNSTSKSKDDGINLEIFMQMLAAQLKQNELAKMRRHPNSVENFCFILEKSLHISTDEQQTLRGLINLGFTFHSINSEEAIEFLKKIVNERIILILTKSSMENLSPSIRDESLLSAIYVIHSPGTYSFDSKFYRGSFPDMTTLCQQLEKDLQVFTSDLTTVASIPTDFAGMSTLNYVQAFIDILLQNDEKKDLKKEMIDFVKEEYQDNPIQLKFIKEFEEHFQGKDAIDWYRREETFVYKMITRAFRVFDPDILFKLRYFIQHLHSQFNTHLNPDQLTLYRTLRIRKDLCDKLKKNQGGFFSFNELVLLKRTPSTIEPSPLNIASKLFHFQIHLANGIPIHHLPTNPNEVLLPFGILFRIDQVEQIDGETFNVKLTANEQILIDGQAITKNLREAIVSPFPVIRMMKLIKHRDLTAYLEYFALMCVDDSEILQDRSANLTLGGSLHSLGTFYYEQKQYQQAMNYLQQSLKIYLRFLPEDDVQLTPTYNNMGSIYHKQDLDEKALEYHQKAYLIQKNAASPDLDSIAAYVGNIASVLMKLERYKEALPYLEQDLQIKQKLHPNENHPEVAVKYHNLAAALYRLEQYSDALVNYQKCLQIELKCHSNKNPTVAVTYYNMATAFEELGRLQEAKEAVGYAIKRLLLTKKEDDEEVQRQMRYLQRLEQKILMKNIFDT